jgi:hypothetical protein
MQMFEITAGNAELKFETRFFSPLEIEENVGWPR